MGVDRPERFELRFGHRARTGHHGILELTAATADGVAVPMPTGDDALLPLVVEYLRVPSTSVYLHPQSPLADMGELGYAEWTQRFDLLLLVVEGYAWPEDEPWTQLRETLDKAKLETSRDWKGRLSAPSRAAGREQPAVAAGAAGWCRELLDPGCRPPTSGTPPRRGRRRPPPRWVLWPRGPGRALGFAGDSFTEGAGVPLVHLTLMSLVLVLEMRTAWASSAGPGRYSPRV